MYKSLNPTERATVASPQIPDTVFTVRAFSGVHMAFTSDSVYNQALNECVTSVTNFAVHVPVKDANGKVVMIKDDDGNETVKVELKEFDEYKPSEHPRIKLSAILPHTMATLVFNKIWGLSTLSRQESGE